MDELSNYIDSNLKELDRMGHHSNDFEKMSEANKEKMRELQRKTEQAIQLQNKRKYGR